METMIEEAARQRPAPHMPAWAGGPQDGSIPGRDAPRPRSRLATARPKPERQPDEETWWARWHLAAAAVACWLFLLLGLVADHLVGAPHQVTLALYGVAYLAGGTFAALAAGRGLWHRH